MRNYLYAVTLHQAIKFVNARETPLAAYLFADSSAVKKRFENEVASGGMAINDVVSLTSSP
jgi:aldehyde dehydrogenase (NAD+)